MRPKIDFLTLSVNDLKKSVAFYRDGLGLATEGVKEGHEDHCLFELERGFSLVLYQRQKFATFTGGRGRHENSAGFIMSYFAESKADVDALLKAALKAGASQIGEVKNDPWGYSANFADLDGHQWEITYFSEG
jgi:predicted lactoylglutathione lyase